MRPSGMSRPAQFTVTFNIDFDLFGPTNIAGSGSFLLHAPFRNVKAGSIHGNLPWIPTHKVNCFSMLRLH